MYDAFPKSLFSRKKKKPSSIIRKSSNLDSARKGAKVEGLNHEIPLILRALQKERSIIE